MLKTLPDLYASVLHDYTAERIHKPTAIVDLLATSTNANISDIKMAYTNKYNEGQLENIVLIAFDGVAKDMAKDILDGKRSETEVSVATYIKLNHMYVYVYIYILCYRKLMTSKSMTMSNICSN